MHDLYREFANLESEGRLDESMGLEKRRWLKMTPANSMHLYETPSGRCWQDLKRVCIERYFFDDMIASGLDGIEWEHFANVVVLRIHIRSGVLQEVFNLKGLKCMRSLDLGLGVVKFVEGLEVLKKLTFVTMSRLGGLNMKYHGESRVGQLPASLKVLDVIGPVIFGGDALGLCTNLFKLTIKGAPGAGHLNLRNCTSMVYLIFQDVTGPLLSRNYFELRGATEFFETESLIKSLIGYGIYLDPFRFNLSTLTFNLSGLKHLQLVDFACNNNLTNLEGLQALPALKFLNLGHCPKLRRLPDLSVSTKLEDLCLIGSRIELWEEDICMLARLKLLKHLVIHKSHFVLKLDVFRRKVLLRILPAQEEYERDLAVPPINLYINGRGEFDGVTGTPILCERKLNEGHDE